jgi:hypothetical protein
MARRIRAIAPFAVAPAFFLVGHGTARAENGIVALRASGCDYYLIYTNSGYVLAEWYGGHDPYKGEQVAGALSSYGMKTAFFGAGAIEGRVYMEEYWLGEDDAVEQLSEQCN